MDQYYIDLKLAAETRKTLKNLSSQLHVQNIATMPLKQKHMLFINALRCRQIYKYLQKRFPTGANTMTFL